MGHRESKLGSPMMVAIVDLFKYHKHKVYLEHYKIKLTEDAPLDETLTEETIDELQTI
jgi:transposase